MRHVTHVNESSHIHGLAHMCLRCLPVTSNQHEVVRAHARVCVCMCACARVCVCLRVVCLRACVRACVHACVRLCACLRASVRVCLRVRARVCIMWYVCARRTDRGGGEPNGCRPCKPYMEAFLLPETGLFELRCATPMDGEDDDVGAETMRALVIQGHCCMCICNCWCEEANGVPVEPVDTAASALCVYAPASRASLAWLYVSPTSGAPVHVYVYVEKERKIGGIL